MLIFFFQDSDLKGPSKKTESQNSSLRFLLRLPWSLGALVAECPHLL